MLWMRMKNWRADLGQQKLYHNNYRKVIQIAANLLYIDMKILKYKNRYRNIT